MRHKLMILSAIAAAACTGAIAGASIPTTPLVDRSDPLASIPDHQPTRLSLEEAKKRIAPRNHYPLETPHGVVPVTELASYGRLRNRMRDQPLYGASSEAEAFAVRSVYHTHSAPARIVQTTTHHSDRHAHASSAAGQPANYVPLEEGIFEQTSDAAPAQPQRHSGEVSGEARFVDVSAMLDDRG